MSATVIVAGTMFALPSKDVPPIVLAVANVVAVAAKATAMLAEPSKDVPPIVRAVAKAVAVAALPVALPALPVTFPVTFPSKLATIVPTEPLTTSDVIEASGTNVNFPAESSHPKKASLAAEPL